MLEKIIAAAIDAGKIALGANREKSILTKEGRANFVTEYDSKIQTFLIKKLSEILPEARFVCEEDDVNQGWDENSYRFVIDPIDGTTNFIHGFHEYAICIGLMKGNNQVCGVVHCPGLDTTYCAEHGKGAFVRKNGKNTQIHISENPLADAVIAAGTSPYRESLLDTSFGLMRALLNTAADIRRSGSAALDICRTAEGLFDIMFECRLSPWDYTAASIILTEAGGKFCDFDKNIISGDIESSYVAGSDRIIKEFIEYYKNLDLKI